MQVKRLFTAACAVAAICGAASAQESMSEITELHLIGDPTGWGTTRPFVKSSDHVYYYVGNLPGGDGETTGRFRATTMGGEMWSWGKYVHAKADKTLLDPYSEPVADLEFDNMPEGDKNFYIGQDGMNPYRLTFDLEEGKAYLTADFSEKMPALTPTLFMVGGATPSTQYWGWDTANSYPMSVDADDPYIFVYQWKLKAGGFRFLFRKDSSWDCHQLHPAFDVSFNKEGLKDVPVEIYWGSDFGDTNWTANDAGFYKVTVNLRDMTLSAEYLGEEHPAGQIITENVYMVGDNTGWGFQPVAKTETPGVYSITCDLYDGQRFRFSNFNEFGVHFQPATDNTWVELAAPGTVPFEIIDNSDNSWICAEDGTYQFTVNLNDRTVTYGVPSAGIEGVKVSDENAPVVYYNLQGMTVNNPKPGQILIRRQGKVSKKIVF